MSEGWRFIMNEHSVFWQNLNNPGCEIARLRYCPPRVALTGTSLVLEQDMKATITYRIVSDEQWQTRQVTTTIEDDQGRKDIEIVVNDHKSWFINGIEQKALAGCHDIDLGFTPVSNTLPIRRLQLAEGEQQDVEVAWLQFPSLRFCKATQRYQRVAERQFMYSNLDSGYVTTITVDDQGLVLSYPEMWEAK